MEPIKIGVINVSDRASAGIYEDIPGKAVVETLKEYLVSEFETVYKVIPDEQDLISETLKYMSDTEGCCLIVTTGGMTCQKRCNSRGNRGCL
jgi:molybdopterin adenylyltransferase